MELPGRSATRAGEFFFCGVNVAGLRQCEGIRHFEVRPSADILFTMTMDAQNEERICASVF